MTAGKLRGLTYVLAAETTTDGDGGVYVCVCVWNRLIRDYTPYISLPVQRVYCVATMRPTGDMHSD
jgi:hypothetical protein